MRAFIFLSLMLGFGCSGDRTAEIKQLKQELRSSDGRARNQAALKAASLGKAGEPLVPELIALLRDPNGGIRSSAAYALRAIDTPAAHAALEHER